MMKLLVFIVLVTSYVSSYSQMFTDEELEKLKVNNEILKDPSSHDTAIAKAYQHISHVYMVSNLDTVIPLSNKTIEAAEIGLAKEPKEDVKKSLIRSMAVAYNDKGSIQFRMGDVAKSLEFFEKSYELLKEVEAHVLVNTALGNIGFIYHKQGDIAKAMEYYQESLKLSREMNDSSNIAFAMNNIAYAYKQMGEVDQSLEYFKESLKIREELGKLQEVSISLNNIAYIYKSQGDTATAISYYKRALEIRKQLKDTEGVCRTYQGIGALYYESGEIDKALEYAVGAYETSVQLNYPEILKATSDLMQRISVLRGRSSNDEKLLREADTYAGNSVQINNEAIISNFSILSEEKQETFFTTVKDDYMEFNSYALFRKDENPKIVETVFDNTIKNKGLLLKSSSAMRNAILGSKNPELIENYEKWIALRVRITELHSLGIDSLELVNKASEYEKELVKQSQLFSDFKNIQDISWKDVQNGLKENETAVEFIHFRYKDFYKSDLSDFTDKVIYCALIVRKDNPIPEMLQLFEEEQLEEILGRFGGNNHDYIADIYGTKSVIKDQLYKLIWKPLEPYLLNTEKVFVAPSGLLHKVSFAAISNGDNVYLCDNFDLEIKSSTSKVVTSKKGTFSAGFQDAKATIFGGIDYNQGESDVKIWSYLEGTKTESEKISKILNEAETEVELFSSSSATESEFKGKAPQSDILHIATHGFFYPDPDEVEELAEVSDSDEELTFRGGRSGFGVTTFVKNPNPLMRSGLVFSGANEVWNKDEKAGQEDGVLTAQEVAHLNLRKTKLVVLSACETGLGDIRGSEGVYGLQRAFKMSGVEYIVMSLWQVPDAETEQFMSLFYKELLKAGTIQEAFRLAQGKMRKKFDPYYWGAFVLIE